LIASVALAVSLSPVTLAAAPSADDAPLPSGVTLDWGKETVTAESPARARISLNGLWRFLPAHDAETAKAPPAQGWGYARVPGDWKRNETIVARGNTGQWRTLKGDELAQAWYERTITIPADWTGRAVLLDLRRVSTDAVVYVGDKEAGRVVWPSGSVDISPYVTPGKPAVIRVRVIATDDLKEVTQYMGHDQVFKREAKLDTRGLIGGVTLLSRPRGAHVADVFVRPSVRTKTLFVDLGTAKVPTGGPAEVTVRALDKATGAAAKTWTQTVNLPAGQGVTTLALPWTDPKLWDLAQPNLYTLQVAVRAPGLDDEYPQVFGFREFWIEGRKFFLNGTEFRLRPRTMNTNPRNGDAVAEFTRQLSEGYNFNEYWPEDIGRRGTHANVDPLYEGADRVGLPISANALSMQPFLFGGKWDDPATQAEYRRHMETELRRIRNHPSVIMYSTSANAFGHNLDQDPRYIGKVGYGAVKEFHEHHEKVKTLLGFIKAFDPTRPVFTHHGAYFGDVNTVNTYLNLIPLQEREEWLSEWAAHGQIPFSAIEFGTPLYSTFLRGRNGYGDAGKTEPFMTEYCAIYLGRRAYDLEKKDYRERIAATFRGGQEYDNWFQFGDRSLKYAPAMLELQDLFIRNTWRSWRTWGLTGGMVPWEDDQDQKAIQANNGPSLAWIAGPKKAFTAKDHNFQPRQKVEKQVVLINDHRAPQPYAASWTVRVGGKTVASGSGRGAIATATNLSLPIAFAAPAAGNGGKADGEITLTATIGPDRHTDRFAFRVFAPTPAAKGALTVFDPVGETTPLLRSLGYTVTPLKPGASLPKSGLLVVGRKVLSQRHLLPASLPAWVKNGGRLLMMAQDPQWTELSLGLRVAPHVSRRVFRVEGTQSLFSGIDDTDMADWAGSGRLVAAYPPYPGYEWYHHYGWRWGNRGSVSSAPIEKPHRSSLRPLLECEFDLAYSPLMEMEYGKGCVTLCTLDLEDYAGTDPAARRIAAKVLDRAARAPIRPKATRLAYVGDDDGAKVLDTLGVKYVRGNVLPASGVVVVGRGATVPAAALSDFTTAGGRVLVLARRPEDEALLGVSVVRSPAFAGSLDVPTWPEAAGLSPSDLRWRSVSEGVLLQPGDAGVTIGAGGLLARKPMGKGIVLFAQIDPTTLPADEKTYLRFTRWRQTRALSQILANLGATFAQDDRLLALLARPEQGFMLAGQWDTQLTNPIPEPPGRVGHGDPGISDRAKALVSLAAPAVGWEKHPVPAYQESYGGKWTYTDGEAVFRTTTDIPAYLAGRDYYLSVGRVDETDETFFNGEQIGKSHNWLTPRGYKVPGRLVKPGRNVIAIRTWDEMIHGGVCGDPVQLYLRVNNAARPVPNLYHDDYRPDYTLKEFELADNPYRYFRW
jgi:beta-galactosidase